MCFLKKIFALFTCNFCEGTINNMLSKIINQDVMNGRECIYGLYKDDVSVHSMVFRE